MAALRASRPRPGARSARADPDQPHHTQQAVRARPRDGRGSGGLSRLEGGAGRRHPHLRGRGRQRRRARALRAVLPGLHAQAMGARPVRARQIGDGADPDPDQYRRPLFHRYVPGDAQGRLHRDVQTHARPSADRGSHRRRLPRHEGRGRRRPHHLYRSDRRIFRLPLRQAAVPQPQVRPPDARGRAPSGGRNGQLSRAGRALHADQRVQAPDRPAVGGDHDHL